MSIHMSAALRLILLATFWIGSAHAQTVYPSLADTLQWMDSTYNPHRETGGGWGHGEEEIYARGTLLKKRNSSFTYQDCVFSLKSQQDPAASAYSGMYTDFTVTFNLRDIDPSTIKTFLLDPNLGGLSCDLTLNKANCSIAELEFETHNQTPLMDYSSHSVYPKLKGADHDSRSTGKTFVGAFYVDDAAYASRFAEAFRHAINLCGGKPSAF